MEGEALLGKYESSSHSARIFCGTSLLAWIDGGKLLAPTLTTVDSDIDVSDAFHMFWRSKAKWCEVGDEWPKHDTYPPHLEGFTPTD